MSILNALDPNAQVGIAGSAPQMPVTAPPSIPPTQFAPQQPQVGVAQNLNQGQPQGMPRPQPVGVSVDANQNAGKPGVANAMAQPSVGKIGTAQQPMTAPSKAFDIQGLSKDMESMVKGLEENQKNQPEQLDARAGQPIDMSAFGAAQGTGQPSVSNAMKMIQGFQQSPLGNGMIGGQPTRQQMMQRLQGR